MHNLLKELSARRSGNSEAHRTETSRGGGGVGGGGARDAELS